MNRAGLACVTLICFAPLGAEVAGCTNRVPAGSELSGGDSSADAASGTPSDGTTNTLTGVSGGTVATVTTGSGGGGNAANSSQTSTMTTTATSSKIGRAHV